MVQELSEVKSAACREFVVNPDPDLLVEEGALVLACRPTDARSKAK